MAATSLLSLGLALHAGWAPADEVAPAAAGVWRPASRIVRAQKAEQAPVELPPIITTVAPVPPPAPVVTEPPVPVPASVRVVPASRVEPARTGSTSTPTVYMAIRRLFGPKPVTVTREVAAPAPLPTRMWARDLDLPTPPPEPVNGTELPIPLKVDLPAPVPLPQVRVPQVSSARPTPASRPAAAATTSRKPSPVLQPVAAFELVQAQRTAPAPEPEGEVLPLPRLPEPAKTATPGKPAAPPAAATAIKPAAPAPAKAPEKPAAPVTPPPAAKPAVPAVTTTPPSKPSTTLQLPRIATPTLNVQPPQLVPAPAVQPPRPSPVREQQALPLPLTTPRFETRVRQQPPVPPAPVIQVQMVPANPKEGLDLRIDLEPPGKDRLFQLDSEDALFERWRQEVRNRAPNEWVEPPPEPVLSRDRYAGRHWLEMCCRVEPYYVCYGRLLFEDKNSERYGWDLGFIQPTVSMLLFYRDVAALPYNWGINRCMPEWHNDERVVGQVLLLPYYTLTSAWCNYECSAGYCLPGDPTPYWFYPPEWSATGTLLETATVLAFVAIF